MTFVTIETEDTDEVMGYLYQQKLQLKNLTIEDGKLEEAFELLTSSEEEK